MKIVKLSFKGIHVEGRETFILKAIALIGGIVVLTVTLGALAWHIGDILNALF